MRTSSYHLLVRWRGYYFLTGNTRHEEQIIIGCTQVEPFHTFVKEHFARTGFS